MFWLDLVYRYAFWFLLSALAVWAARAGGRPERLAAYGYLAAAILSVVARDKGAYVQVEASVFAIDLCLLAGLLWLVITADRYWPMPSAALQAISCLAHLGKLIEPKSDWLGYQLMAEASSYPTLLVLAVGIWREQWRRATRNVSSTFVAY